jgi:mycothiol synthase
MLDRISPTLGVAPPLTSRALHEDDARSVCALVRRVEERDTGEAMVDLEDIISDWQRPSFDLAAHAIGVFEGDALVGCAEVFRGRRAEAHVDLHWEGRGIGSALAGWTEDLARQGGSGLVGQSVPEGSRGAALLRVRGYEPLWTSWVLAMPTDRDIAPAQLPLGVRIRAFEVGRDEQAAYRTIEDAFNEWPDRDPAEFDDWAAAVLRRPGFQPWQLLLAVEGDTEVVGVCHLVVSDDTAWVNQVAVRRDRRGLGLGRALLLEAFAAGRRRGTGRAR